MASDGVYNIEVTLRRMRSDFNWRGSILGILPTFYDDVTRESKATLEDLKKQYGELVLGPIHRATILRECAVEGKTIFELDPHCRAARQYQSLVEYINSKDH
jgi:chromosome partitioning protein